MRDTTYSFPVGGLTCIALRDGYFNYPLAAFFPTAPQAELETALRARGLPTTQVGTPYTLLYIDTGGHRVLVDTGAGTLGEHPERMFPGLDHSTTVTGQLVPNLRAAGIEPGDIDTVVITHAHPDHIAGNLTDGALTFPNAQYFISRPEWEFWTGETAAAAPPPFVAVARQNLVPVRDRVTLLDGEAEIVPGLYAIPTYGHTPGHTAVLISSGRDTLLHISDLALHPLHLEHPDWHPRLDMDAAQAAETRRQILDRAVSDRILLFAHHFAPFPALGHVSQNGRAWLWQPLSAIS